MQCRKEDRDIGLQFSARKAACADKKLTTVAITRYQRFYALTHATEDGGYR
jgi:transposase-like protein